MFQKLPWSLGLWSLGPWRRRFAVWVTAATATFAAETAAVPAEAAATGRAMGTTWAAKWVQPVPALAPAVVERQLAERLEELERIFSPYRADSELSRFNRSQSTGWIAVSCEFATVAQRAREISQLTGGAFDITVAPLLELWGLGSFRARETPPTEAEVVAARRSVDWRRLEVQLDPPALRKVAANLTVDFSSIAKGFSVDVLSQWLVVHGATNHLVRIGGDLRAAGAGPAGGGWRVAIEQPGEGKTEIARVLALSDQALSTSGQYRNFVMLGARRVGHIIDPRTGQPPGATLASVSVLHALCATSSALATGLFVLGPEEGLALAERERLAALFTVRKHDGGLAHRGTTAFAAQCDAKALQIR